MNKRCIKLYYQPVANNFGDMLSPRLVTALTGRDCIRAKPQGADLVAVGSLLDKAMKKRWRRMLAGRFTPLGVWGTGFLYPGADFTGRLLNVMAVRGKETRARIKGLDGHCALGDPALLAGRLFSRASSCSNRRVLIAPGLTDRGGWIKAALQNENLGGDRLTVTDDTDLLLQSIANADLVVSSAMHPMVVAISYGVPAVWVAPDNDDFEGGSWKYRDFFSAFGIQQTALPRDPGYWMEAELDMLMEAAEVFAPTGRQLEEISDRLCDALII